MIKTTPTSPPRPSKLHHVRRRGLPGGDALDIAAPQVEGVAFLSIVAVSVVHGRDAALDVVGDVRNGPNSDSDGSTADGISEPRAVSIIRPWMFRFWMWSGRESTNSGHGSQFRITRLIGSSNRRRCDAHNPPRTHGTGGAFEPRRVPSPCGYRRALSLKFRFSRAIVSHQHGKIRRIRFVTPTMSPHPWNRMS